LKDDESKDDESKDDELEEVVAECRKSWVLGPGSWVLRPGTWVFESLGLLLVVKAVCHTRITSRAEDRASLTRITSRLGARGIHG
jgi:hypothetical protein